MSNGVFNFNFLAPVFSEILGGPKFMLGGALRPWTPPIGEFFLPKASASQYLIIVFQFEHSSSSSFRDFRGSQI